MTDYESPRLEIVARKPVVEIDDDGATHYFDNIRRTIYVVAAGEIEHTEPLGAHHLRRWVQYVADQRGWRECRYTERRFAHQLAAAIGGS